MDRYSRSCMGRGGILFIGVILEAGSTISQRLYFHADK